MTTTHHLTREAMQPVSTKRDRCSTRYATRSMISTAKKPKAAIKVHLSTSQPKRLKRGWPVPTKKTNDTPEVSSSKRISQRNSNMERDLAAELLYQARVSWAKPSGASFSSSKVTTSHASVRTSSSRNSLLFKAWPARKAL